jgi:hypothetical protein
MKIALFKDVKYDWSTPVAWSVEDGSASLTGYTRVSETVEVDFPPLPKEEVARQSLDLLDAEELTLRSGFQQQLDSIKNRRAEIQSLTYTPAA